MRAPSPSLPAVLALLVSIGSAQVDSNKIERVWSSVSWVLYGDRTPLKSPYHPATLTPLGAQQLRTQGAVVRDRYLRPSLPEDAEAEDTRPISGISRNAIDNNQVSIISTTDSYVVGSAMAFLQGLYPPVTQAFPSSTGGIEAASLSNGSIVNYPLDGYQYPNIRTVSRVVDPDSIWIQGSGHCPKYTNSMLYPFNDSYASPINDANIDFYRNLYNRTFKEAFNLANTNFFNAYNLYDFANYRYVHSNNSSITMSEILRLRALASVEQRWRNGNLTVSGFTQGDRIRAIAGRTMAAKVMALFMDHIRSGGANNKLNLVFSSFEPFVAFFSLAGLTAGPSFQLFNPLPFPGATMLFELFSVGDVNDASFPGVENLNVRFLYKNSTDPDSKFRVYSIFDNVVAFPEMRFTQFARYMDGVSIGTIKEWCGICDGATFFCAAVEGDGGCSTGGTDKGFWGSGRSGLSAAAAGAVGAAVTLAVTGLVLLGAMLLGGLRFYKADPKTKRGSLFGGGFKGPEKKADDADVEFAKSGVRHERVGSWELRDGTKKKITPSARSVSPISPGGGLSSGAGVTVMTPDLIHPSRLRARDDDNLSVYGQEPVRPREF
ncbi:histidine phosphatase superfamily [Cladorrhinum sp. PSN259]|nr:histidine phosphatase superfamily [Cladorrhinum sp. PSN259]